MHNSYAGFWSWRKWWNFRGSCANFSGASTEETRQVIKLPWSYFHGSWTNSYFHGVPLSRPTPARSILGYKCTWRIKVYSDKIRYDTIHACIASPSGIRSPHLQKSSAHLQHFALKSLGELSDMPSRGPTYSLGELRFCLAKGQLMHLYNYVLYNHKINNNELHELHVRKFNGFTVGHSIILESELIRTYNCCFLI